MDGFDALIQFIDEHVTKDKDLVTHTRISGGKYFFTNEDMDKLLNLLDGKFWDLDLVERHNSVASIYVDADFKQPFGMKSRQYDEEFIKEFVNVYHNIIKKNIKVRNEDMICMVAIRDDVVIDHKRERVRDGLHIYYPHIVTEPRVQKMIRDQVLLEISPLLDKLVLTNTLEQGTGTGSVKHKYDDVIDKSVIYTNGVLMYGCTKLDQPIGENDTKVTFQPYKVRYIYDDKMRSMDIEYYTGKDYAGKFNCSNITEILSIRRHDPIDCQQLTVEGSKNITEYKNDVDKSSAVKVLNKSTLKLVDGQRSNAQYSLQEVVDLINMLGAERWDTYDGWTRLGWAIHNIDPRSGDLFELFKNGSMRSKSYTPGCCERHWVTAAKNGVVGGSGGLLGMGSLHIWAKSDNPETYSKWRLSKIKPTMEESDDCTHYTVAKVLHKLFSGNHRCVTNKSATTWFTFAAGKHRWETDNSGSDLRIKIPTLLVTEYAKLIEDYNKSATNPELSEEERMEFSNKANVFTSLIRELKSRPFANNIMAWAVDLFGDKTFIDRIDEVNKDLICFENGVYDLAHNVFRDGDPSDYISMSTGIEYTPFCDIGEDDSRVKEIYALLESIFPDPAVMNYQLLVLASCLDGHVLEQKFRLWMGRGSNGKGILRKLVDMSFGDYCHTLKATVLTRKQGDAENANSSIAQTKGCRIVFFDEPDEGDKIHVGTMKHYSGGDPIQARMIYGIPFEFYPQFSMILLTNVFPELPPNDDGTWRRMEPTYFPNKFTEDEPTEKNEYKMDKELPKRLGALAPVFMSILIEKYKEYRKTGIVIPAAVREFKRQYQRNCDTMLDFLDDTFSCVENKECKITIDDMYVDYRFWFKNNGPEKSHKMLASKNFKEYVTKQFKGRIVESSIVGIKYTKNGSSRREKSTSLAGYSVGFKQVV